MTKAARARIRAVVIEDASEQRDRLVSLLEDEGDIEVVACPSTAPEAIELVARTRPDVVILDLHLRDGSCAPRAPSLHGGGSALPFQ
jgi:CheY-like chemotaxis protein